MTGSYTDGSANASAGTAELPTILKGYVTRPPWEVAGVDYAVGVPVGTTLKNPSSIAMAGVSVNTTNHTITVTGDNVTLSGYDFSLNNGWSAVVEGANDSIENSRFVVGPNQGALGTSLTVTSSASNFSLIKNEFDGNNVAVTAQLGSTVSIASSGKLTIQYNYFHNSGGDMIDLNATTAPQVELFQNNLFTNIGVTTAHADTIQWYDTKVGAGSDIGFNTVYQTVAQPGAGMGALVAGIGGPEASVSGLMVNNNTVIDTASADTANFLVGFEADPGVPAANVVIHDNYIDPTGVNEYTGSPWFPTGYYGADLAIPTVMSNVIDMVTKAQVAVPSASSKTSQGYYTYMDAAGHSPVLSDVLSVSASQASGTLTPGNMVSFTIHLDESFTVTGAPTLTLNAGGTAVYTGGSGTNALTFWYRVPAATKAVSTLAITQVELPNGATVKDSIGNSANLAGAVVGFTGLAVKPVQSEPTPVAKADTALTPENRALKIAVLANDDGNGGTINPASVTISAAPTRGTTSINATTGAILYTPATGFHGTDTFKYSVADTDGATSAPATVTVTVDAPPTAIADSTTTAENQAVSIAVLANDSDVDGTINPASVSTTKAAAHGTTTVNTMTGAVTYTPVNGFYGTDTFKYTVADTRGVTSAPATVTVTVNKPANGSGYNDGSANAPAATVELPNLLSGYAAAAPWAVAGVDYAVGVPSNISLNNPASIAMAGVSVNNSNHTVTVTSSNVTLNGYDFGLDGGWGINIAAGVTNTVIENSHFLVGANNNVPVNAAAGCGNLTLLDNTFDGGSSQSGAVWALINYNGSGIFTAQYNAFLNAPDDAIDFSSGTMTTVVKYNLFDNLGTSPGSHPDSIQYTGVNASNSVDSFNTIYQPNPSGMQGIQLQAQNGSTLSNTAIENNVIVAKAASSVEMSYSIAVIESAGNTINGATVEDNYIDYGGAYGPFYPPSGSNLTFGGNFDMATGAQIPNPSGTAATDVSGISATPSSGTQYPGTTITLTLNLDQAEFVAGTPTLSLNDGGTATYASGSGTSKLNFSYTVASADKTVTTLGITQLNLPNGASIINANGDAANLAGAVTTLPGLGIDPPSVLQPVDTATRTVFDKPSWLHPRSVRDFTKWQFLATGQSAQKQVIATAATMTSGGQSAGMTLRDLLAEHHLNLPTLHLADSNSKWTAQEPNTSLLKPEFTGHSYDNGRFGSYGDLIPHTASG